jgi:hypothetical protein
VCVEVAFAGLTSEKRIAFNVDRGVTGCSEVARGYGVRVYSSRRGIILSRGATQSPRRVFGSLTRFPPATFYLIPLASRHKPRNSFRAQLCSPLTWPAPTAPTYTLIFVHTFVCARITVCECSCRHVSVCNAKTTTAKVVNQYVGKMNSVCVS